ncbi:MAG: filamentous hemagglutinin N-terminal domain-containing protein, partial [Phycisphaerales bacterium]
MSKLDARRDGQGVSGGAAWLSRKAELFHGGNVLGLGFRGGWTAALGGVVVASVCSAAFAGPEGASVAAGNVNITRNGSTTLIQASNNSIINYRSFDIGRGETVRFLQPNANSRVLNRITSARPTQIDGTLSANGRVYIINPAGVLFGQGSVVNTARLYAVGGHLADRDFVRGIDHFTDVRGEVRNYGTLSADFIAMVGAKVDN